MSKLSRALVGVTKLASPVTVASLFSPEAAKQNAIAEQKAPVDFTPIANISDTAKMAEATKIAFVDELVKLNAAADYQLTAVLEKQASHEGLEHAGLGLLALPSIDELQAHVRAGLSGKYNPHEVEKREFLPAVAHPAAEVVGLGALMPAFEHAVTRKHGSVSAAEAARAADRLDFLEGNKPTKRQMADYGAIGAVTTPAISALKSVVSGDPVLKGAKGRLRSIAGHTVGGALLAGALPLLQNEVGRRTETSKLKKFLKQDTAKS